MRLNRNALVTTQECSQVYSGHYLCNVRMHQLKAHYGICWSILFALLLKPSVIWLFSFFFFTSWWRQRKSQEKNKLSRSFQFFAKFLRGRRSIQASYRISTHNGSWYEIIQNFLLITQMKICPQMFSEDCHKPVQRDRRRVCRKYASRKWIMSSNFYHYISKRNVWNIIHCTVPA